LSGRGLCDELITRPEESYRMCCVVVCDLETSRIGAPYICDISTLRVKLHSPPYSAEVKNAWRCTTIVRCALMPGFFLGTWTTLYFRVGS